MNTTQGNGILQRWNIIQHELMPKLRNEIGTLTPKLLKLVRIQGMLEAERSRQHIGQQCRLRHQQANQILSQQINPHVFLAHLRGFAAQRFYAQRGFDVANIQFDLSARLV